MKIRNKKHSDHKKITSSYLGINLTIILTVLSLILCSPRASVISETDIAFGKSCLLAKTNNTALRSSSSES